MIPNSKRITIVFVNWCFALLVIGLSLECAMDMQSTYFDWSNTALIRWYENAWGSIPSQFSPLIRFTVKSHFEVVAHNGYNFFSFIAYSIYLLELVLNIVISFVKKVIKMEPSYFCKFCNLIYRPTMTAEYCHTCHRLMTLLPGYFQQLTAILFPIEFNGVLCSLKTIFYFHCIADG